MIAMASLAGCKDKIINMINCHMTFENISVHLSQMGVQKMLCKGVFAENKDAATLMIAI